MKPLLISAIASLLCLVCLAACQERDWRAQQIALAEEKMRAEVNDPSAQFSNIQVTGDEATGQICGQVKAAGAWRARFIVYIDGTAGPFVAAGEGRHPMPNDRFDAAWRADCLGEGYKPEWPCGPNSCAAQIAVR